MAETQSAPSLRELSEAPVAILYRNWRGEVDVRQIMPRGSARAFWFGSTEWHPEPQWLMTATDVEKSASRDFALSGILAWGAEAIAAREATQTEAVAAAQAEGADWKDIKTAPAEDEVTVDLWLVDRKSGQEWRQTDTWRHDGRWIVMEFDEIHHVESDDVVATHWRLALAPPGRSVGLPLPASPATPGGRTDG